MVRKGITLVELIVVVVIIGVLATLAMPQYLNARRRTEDRQAEAMLRMIREAEKIIRLEEGLYVSCRLLGRYVASRRRHSKAINSGVVQRQCDCKRCVNYRIGNEYYLACHVRVSLSP